MGNPIAQVIFGVPYPSYDGKRYTAWPQGDKPAGITAGVTLTVSGPSASADGGALTHDQDWINRSTAAGVIMQCGFTQASDVTNYIHGDALAGNPRWDSADGIGSCRSLHIPILKTHAANSGYWRRGLNDSWTTNGVGMGSTRFHTQFRVKLDPNFLINESTRGSGKKICNLAGYMPESPNSSDSFTSFEVVLANFFYRGYLEAYRASVYSTSDSLTDDATLLEAMQPWYFPEGQWFTVYIITRVVAFGQPDGVASAGNELDIYIAGPADDFYTPIYRARDLSFGFDAEYPNGISGLWLGPYDTGKTSSAYDTGIRYTQAINSLNPIPVPLPVSQITNWQRNATEIAWDAVPGTAAGTILAAVASLNEGDAAPICTAWNGMAFDQDAREVMAVGNGGHGDWASNYAIRLPLSQESCAWQRMNLPSAAAAAPQQLNSTGARGDGSKATDHTYSIVQYGGGRVWFPAFGALSGSVGYPSTAVWSFDPGAANNATLGYEYHGLAVPGMSWDSGVTTVESGSAYDPISRKIWYMMQNQAGGAVGMWSVDVDTPYAITTYTGIPFGITAMWLAVHPQRRLLIIGGGGGLYRMSLDSPGVFTQCTESGTHARIKEWGAQFHWASNAYQGAILCWHNNGGALRVLDIPENLSGTWAWRSVSAVSGVPPAAPTQGTWKKFGVIEDVGDGRSMIVLVTTVTNAVYYMLLPKQGV